MPAPVDDVDSLDVGAALEEEDAPEIVAELMA